VTDNGDRLKLAEKRSPDVCVPPVMSRRDGLKTAAILAPTLLLARRSHAAPKGQIAVLHTNDTHSRMKPFSAGSNKGAGGVARRATLINQVRARGPTLLVDAGDTFQGTAWFNEFKGKVDIQVMNALGYDATAIGNHDFDAGAAQLKENLVLAPNMRAVSANYRVAKDSILCASIAASTIVDRGGLKIGIFGLGVQLEGLVNPKLHLGVSYDDPREAARKQVGLLRDRGCDLVIALSHLGYEGYRGEVGDTDWPKDIAGVDYVVGGHTHTLLETPTVVSHASGWKTHVMQVGHSGLFLGHARLTVNGRGEVRVASKGPRPVRAS